MGSFESRGDTSRKKGEVDDLSDMRKKLWETLGEERARNGVKFTGLKGHIFQNIVYLSFSDGLEGQEGIPVN